MKTILAAVLLLCLLAPAPVLAQTVATLGEKSIGTACNNGADAVNFDTLAQCSATSGSGTFQKAPLFVGQVTSPPYASTACDAAKAGMLQYTGGVVQYCNGTEWGGLSGSVTITTVGAWTTATCPAGYKVLSCNGPGYNGTGTTVCGVANNDTYCSAGCGGGPYFVTATCYKNLSPIDAGSLGPSTAATSPSRADDQTTGLFSATASTVSIATSGTERLRVTATGSVGIGTTSPTQRLDLGGGNIMMGYEMKYCSFSAAQTGWLACSCSSGKQILGGSCRYAGGGAPLGVDLWDVSAGNNPTGASCYKTSTGDLALLTITCANIR